LLAETYDLMKRGLGLGPKDLEAVYTQWNRTEVNSYLLEITGKIFGRRDERLGEPLIDLILDKAKQKGTGMWTSWDAMDLQTPTPNLDVAVVMRDMSGHREERLEAAKVLSGPGGTFNGDKERFIHQLKNALYAGMIATYAQGLALLRAASRTYNYGLDLEAVARIWRGGCIIRAALLEDIRTAFRNRPDLSNLLLDPHLGQEFMARQTDLRDVVGLAADLGLPALGFMAALGYYDAYRSARLPANLIQAQRDFFGAHTFERLDAPGSFHVEWD
jgi:6-phosphogluconate dehydrogenase